MEGKEGGKRRRSKRKMKREERALRGKWRGRSVLRGHCVGRGHRVWSKQLRPLSCLSIQCGKERARVTLPVGRDVAQDQ